MREKINNILILKFSAIGDILQSIPAIRAVRLHFQSANIDILVAEDYENIIKNCPYVNNIITFKRPFRREFTKIDLKYFINYSQYISQKKYDLIIDLQRKARSYSLQLCALPFPKKFRIIFPLLVEFFLPRKFKIASEIKVNDVEKYLSYLKDYNISIIDSDKKLEMWFSDEELRFSEEFFNEHKINKGKDLLIGVTPCVKWDSKKWGIEKYAKVSDFIIENYNATALVFGGPDEADEVRDMINLMRNKAVNVAGKTPTIIHAGALIKYCKLFISGDTGLLHIADAAGVRTISIWGSTKPDVNGPIGQEHIKLCKAQELNCWPCYKFNCKREDKMCMKLITVEEVIESVKSVFQYYSKRQK